MAPVSMAQNGVTANRLGEILHNGIASGVEIGIRVSCDAIDNIASAIEFVQDPSVRNAMGMAPIIPGVWKKADDVVDGIRGIKGVDLPGTGKDWTKLRGDQGWRDAQGNIWKKDQLHKDHWDISDPKSGKKIREVDFNGNEIWPNGPKNKNKRP